MTDLPPALSPGHYRVELVCSGNICRSPSADVVLASMVADSGLPVLVTSSGIGDWHVGDPMDPRSATALRAAGYDPSRHRARQVSPQEPVDVYLAMDWTHADALVAMGIDAGRVLMFRDFDPDGPGDVLDPYFGGSAGFADVLATVERTSRVLVLHLAVLLEGAPR